jgi:hypothetical protein
VGFLPDPVFERALLPFTRELELLAKDFGKLSGSTGASRRSPASSVSNSWTRALFKIQDPAHACMKRDTSA